MSKKTSKTPPSKPKKNEPKKKPLTPSVPLSKDSKLKESLKDEEFDPSVYDQDLLLENFNDDDDDDDF